MAAARTRGWRYRAAVVVLALAALGALLRLVADPLAAHYTKKSLGELDGVRGRFGGVHVTLLRPSYTVTDLELYEEPVRRGEEPMFRAERLTARLRPGALLRGELVAALELWSPKLVVHRAAEKEKAKAPLPIDVRARLLAQRPMLIERVSVKDGELLYVDVSESERPRLWLHEVEATLENLATRPELDGGEPLTIAARGALQRSGLTTLFLSMDPFARGLAFAGRAQVRHLDVRDVHEMIASRTGVTAEKGTFEMFTAFRAEDGVIDGGIKPVLEGVELGPAGGSFVDRVKAKLGDTTLDLLERDEGGEERLATEIPFKGEVTAPAAQLLPTVIGVLRNAFVVGLVGGFGRLPPPTAEEKEGVLEQIAPALSEKAGAPKAQPRREGEDDKGKRAN